jgi:hypothetical protein
MFAHRPWCPCSRCRLALVRLALLLLFLSLWLVRWVAA